MFVFRKPAKRAYVDGQGSVRIGILRPHEAVSEGGAETILTVPRNLGITPGTKVQVVCEITADTTRHPNHYSRLPDHGGIDNWHILNTLGTE